MPSVLRRIVLEPVFEELAVVSLRTTVPGIWQRSLPPRTQLCLLVCYPTIACG